VEKNKLGGGRFVIVTPEHVVKGELSPGYVGMQPRRRQTPGSLGFGETGPFPQAM